jgi:hypothetical protein
MIRLLSSVSLKKSKAGSEVVHVLLTRNMANVKLTK